MSGQQYVAMLSGGKGSWGAVRYMIDGQGVDPASITGLFTDTNSEDDDLYRFLRESTANLGVELVHIDNGGMTVWDAFRKARMIGNTRLSVCSRMLKQEPARKWLEENTDPEVTTVVVGIDFTEAHRLVAIERNYLPWSVVAPLTERGSWHKRRVDEELAKAGIAQPRLYAQGFPHNNCAGACVRGGQGQWALLLARNPGRYAEQERQENEMRADLGKDVAILRDRSLDARLAYVGLRQSDIETHYEAYNDPDDPDDDHERPVAFVHRETQTVLDLPEAVPLPLSVLRDRIEDEQVDMLDLGSCGCFLDFGEGA